MRKFQFGTIERSSSLWRLVNVSIYLVIVIVLSPRSFHIWYWAETPSVSLFSCHFVSLSLAPIFCAQFSTDKTIWPHFRVKFLITRYLMLKSYEFLLLLLFRWFFWRTWLGSGWVTFYECAIFLCRMCVGDLLRKRAAGSHLLTKLHSPGQVELWSRFPANCIVPLLLWHIWVHFMYFENKVICTFFVPTFWLFSDSFSGSGSLCAFLVTRQPWKWTREKVIIGHGGTNGQNKDYISEWALFVDTHKRSTVVYASTQNMIVSNSPWKQTTDIAMEYGLRK